MSDHDRKSEAPTVPPRASSDQDGDDDPYNASTKVGPASEDILALVRAAQKEDSRPPKLNEDSASDHPTVVTNADELTRKVAASLAAADLPKIVSEPPSPSKRAPASVPAREAAPPPARAEAVAPAPRAGALPPAASILLLFGAIAVTLAALVR